MNLPAHGTTSPDPSVVSVLKQHTKQNGNNNISPGPVHTSLGEIGPNRLAVPAHRLAVPAHRQAPTPFQRHCFPVTAWRSTPYRQAPCNAGVSLVIPIAWRHQQTARRHNSNSLLLVLALKLVGFAILEYSRIDCTLVSSEFVSFQPYTFPRIAPVPNLNTFRYSLSFL